MMIRFKHVLSAVMLVAFLGCATVSEDMRLSDLGFQELSKGNYEQAEKYLNESLLIDRFNPYAILNLGVVYHNTGRLEKAREAYNNVISLEPKATAAVSKEGSNTGKSLVEIARENLSKLQQ